MKRATALLAAVILMTVGFVAPVTATQPDQFVAEDSWTEYLTSCDGFDLEYDIEVKVRFTTFYDKNGDIDRHQNHWHLVGILHRSDGVGPTVTDHSTNMNVFSSWDDLVITMYGTPWNTVLPGYGPVVKVSGNITWDETAGWPPVITATGWNASGLDLSPEAQATLCEYFG
ncbi:MAG: hypothetical protein ABFR53_00815 [Actinomycetota bacterium]